MLIKEMRTTVAESIKEKKTKQLQQLSIEEKQLLQLELLNKTLQM